MKELKTNDCLPIQVRPELDLVVLTPVLTVVYD